MQVKPAPEGYTGAGFFRLLARIENMSIIRASLTVYARHGCHLCEDLLMQLHDLKKLYDFEFAVVDVDSSDELAQRYGEYVPVVMQGETRICQYFLDQTALLNALDVMK